MSVTVGLERPAASPDVRLPRTWSATSAGPPLLPLPHSLVLALVLVRWQEPSLRAVDLLLRCALCPTLFLCAPRSQCRAKVGSQSLSLGSLSSSLLWLPRTRLLRLLVPLPRLPLQVLLWCLRCCRHALRRAPACLPGSLHPLCRAPGPSSPLLLPPPPSPPLTPPPRLPQPLPL